MDSSMTSLGLALLRLGKGFARGLRDLEFRALLLVLVGILLGGTIFFHSTEGWSWTDAIYFAVMTLATISPPGFTLTSDLSKVFMIVYVIGGMGAMISFVIAIGRHIVGSSHRTGKDGHQVSPDDTSDASGS
jgi:hypothetical protein